jgi:hypothetical protein
MDQGKKVGKWGRKGTGKHVRNKEETKKSEGINGRIKEDKQKSRNKGMSRKKVELGLHWT